MDLSQIDVLILSGGKGARLRSVVSDKPKTLADIGDKPFLEILIENLAGHGFKKFVLCVGYLKEQIIDYFKDNPVSGADIRFSEESEPLGTGGAVKNAENYVNSNYFMVVNGDSFLKIDFGKFFGKHLESGSVLTLALAEVENANEFGSVEMDGGRIVSFREKSAVDKPGLVNAGAYFMKKDIFGLMPDGSFSIEKDFFPNMADKGFCYGFVSGEDFIDIGTPESYKKAQKGI